MECLRPKLSLYIYQDISFNPAEQSLQQNIGSSTVSQQETDQDYQEELPRTSAQVMPATVLEALGTPLIQPQPLEPINPRSSNAAGWRSSVVEALRRCTTP